MSNEFEQEYFGFEPQKPITEKQPAPEAAPPQRTPVPETAPQEAQSFNPIRHTAVYSDNRFEQQPPQRTPQAAPEIAAAPPVEPAPDAKPQKAPEPKANTALVIVVIVMSLLLCAGMFGILAYSVFQSNDADGKGSQKTQDSQTAISLSPRPTSRKTRSISKSRISRRRRSIPKAITPTKSTKTTPG